MIEKNKVYCNACGRELGDLSQIQKEDFVCIEKEWGYFSNKDGEHHIIHICETCYDRWIHTFQIPVEKKEVVEMI